MVKDVNGQILRDGVVVRRRLVVYFEQVLNVADVREGNINVKKGKVVYGQEPPVENLLLQNVGSIINYLQ